MDFNEKEIFSVSLHVTWQGVEWVQLCQSVSLPKLQSDSDALQLTWSGPSITVVQLPMVTQDSSTYQ